MRKQFQLKKLVRRITPEIDKEICRLFYKENKTQKDISEILGISRTSIIRAIGPRGL